MQLRSSNPTPRHQVPESGCRWALANDASWMCHVHLGAASATGCVSVSIMSNPGRDGNKPACVAGPIPSCSLRDTVEGWYPKLSCCIRVCPQVPRDAADGWAGAPVRKGLAEMRCGQSKVLPAILWSGKLPSMLRAPQPNINSRAFLV